MTNLVTGQCQQEIRTVTVEHSRPAALHPTNSIDSSSAPLADGTADISSAHDDGLAVYGFSSRSDATILCLQLLLAVQSGGQTRSTEHETTKVSCLVVFYINSG